ncbi:hypothetical protein DITRI_Ditri17bG0001100 [Diplodiscus trichospermus]
MSKWKAGQRRSPRISALDACKAQQSKRVGHTALSPQPQARAMSLRKKKTQGPASRTRASARKIRTLRPLEDVAAQQGSSQQSLEDHPSSSDQPTSQGGNSPKYDDKAASPEVGLQSFNNSRLMSGSRVALSEYHRRDIYEVFAEPVDPEEVVDYYEIIKEPMDFGTMRAKLHEGMYTSLQQFEHDVYLISRNAMRFNSSATIYFRQARAIHELAKKVFQALKTDPENFESEFLETRRRTSRRLMSEARAPSYSSSSKLATNLRACSKSKISSKAMPCSVRSSSDLGKSISGVCGYNGTDTDFNARNHEVHSGSLNGWKYSFAEVDRRCTYRPLTSLLSENDSIVSTVYSDSKPLIPGNQQDISYRDSLMLFVKDLGPTAQMIAKQKLIGCSVDASNCWTPNSKRLFQEPECLNLNAFRSTQRGLPLLNYAFDAEYENLFDHLHRGPNISGTGTREKAYARHQMFTTNAPAEAGPSSDERKIPVAFRGDDCSSNAVDVFGLLGCDRLNQDQWSEIQLDSYPSSVGVRELNLSLASGKNPTPIIMVRSNFYSEAPRLESSLAQSQASMLDLRSRNNLPSRPQQTMGSSICGETNCSRQGIISPVLRSGGQDITAQDKIEVSGSVEARHESKGSQRMKQVGSQFIFDSPFLTTRLDQINSLGKDKILHQGYAGAEDPFMEKVNWKRQLACSHHRELRTETYNGK